MQVDYDDEYWETNLRWYPEVRFRFRFRLLLNCFPFLAGFFLACFSSFSILRVFSPCSPFPHIRIFRFPYECHDLTQCFWFDIPFFITCPFIPTTFIITLPMRKNVFKCLTYPFPPPLSLSLSLSSVSMFRVLGRGKLGWEDYSFLVHLPGYIGRLALLCISLHLYLVLYCALVLLL
jgi:hypothetical protein